MNGRKPIAHGEPKGYQAHKLRGEDPCDECRAGWRAYMASWRAKQPARPRKPLAPCGSVAAYARHLRRKEQTCAACRQAKALEIADYRAARGAA